MSRICTSLQRPRCECGRDRHALGTSVVAWSANTTVYYDHWENGYNFDPNNPAATADETYTLATPGTIKVFDRPTFPTFKLREPCAGR